MHFIFLEYMRFYNTNPIPYEKLRNRVNFEANSIFSCLFLCIQVATNNELFSVCWYWNVKGNGEAIIISDQGSDL